MTLKQIKTLSFAFVLTALTGCSAVHTSVSKSELTTETKMTESIFLDPVASDKRTVFVQIRNTSDKSDFLIEQQVKTNLMSRGYQVVQEPEKANYWLQANILKVVKDDGNYGKDAFRTSSDGALAGAAVGSTMGSGDGKIATALAGATIGLLVNASVQDVYFTVVTDIQISARIQAGNTVNVEEKSTISQGSSTTTTSSYEKQSDMKQYRTRIVSMANKANLEYVEAAPQLKDGLAKSIAGIF